MKFSPLWLIALVFVTPFARAEEANGLRMTVQKTVLDKSKDRDAFNQWDKVEKALGLKVVARNTSVKDFPAGTLNYVVIVKRWGFTPIRYESYSGSADLPALLKGAETSLVAGKVPLGGYEIGGNRKQFQDSIEGWQIIVTHEGNETLKFTSTSSFDKLFAKAKAVGN